MRAGQSDIFEIFLFLMSISQNYDNSICLRGGIHRNLCTIQYKKGHDLMDIQ